MRRYIYKYCLVIVHKTWMVKEVLCTDVAALGHTELSFLIVCLEMIENAIRL